MSSPQYPHDPYGGDQQGNVWEQSQPTGNVWDPQATDAWGQQAVSSDSPHGLPPSPPPGGPQGPSPPPPPPPPPPHHPPPRNPLQQQPPQYQPRPSNVFATLFDFGFARRTSTAALRTIHLLGTVTAALLAFAILAVGFTGQNTLLMVIAPFLAAFAFFTTVAVIRVILETYRAVAGELD